MIETAAFLSMTGFALNSECCADYSKKLSTLSTPPS